MRGRGGWTALVVGGMLLLTVKVGPSAPSSSRLAPAAQAAASRASLLPVLSAADAPRTMEADASPALEAEAPEGASQEISRVLVLRMETCERASEAPRPSDPSRRLAEVDGALRLTAANLPVFVLPRVEGLTF